MRTAFFRGAVLCLSLLTGMTTHAIVATQIGAGSGLSGWDSQAVVNNNGDVAFFAVGSGGTDGVYFYSDKDKQVYRQDFGQIKADRHTMRMSSSGSIGFVGSTAAGDAIYAKTASATGGGNVLTIHGTNFGSYTAPAITDGGPILFTAIDGANGRGIYSANSSGQIITIYGRDDLSFTPVGDISSNNAQQFVIAGTDNATGTPGIYSRPSGGNLLTIYGSNFGVDSPAVGRDGGTIRWTGSDFQGRALFVSSVNDGVILTIRGDNFGSSSINSAGDILYDVTNNATNERALYESYESSLNNRIERKIMAIGEPLGGSTIDDFSIGSSALNDIGEFVFYAHLADGSSGLYLASVPEPVVLLPIGGAFLLLRRRGRG
jgi:hypothetical protein